MEEYETFRGDNWWSTYRSQGYTEKVCKRTSDVLSTEVTKRLASFGAYMMRAIGEMVNADEDSLDALYQIMEDDHPNSTFGGFMLARSNNEYTSVLQYLTAPESEKEWYRDEASFFLQLCAAYADAQDAYDNITENMPMLSGEIDPTTGEVICWHGFSPWEEDLDKKTRQYMSPEEWWYEAFPEDRPNGDNNESR